MVQHLPRLPLKRHQHRLARGSRVGPCPRAPPRAPTPRGCARPVCHGQPASTLPGPGLRAAQRTVPGALRRAGSPERGHRPASARRTGPCSPGLRFCWLKHSTTNNY